MKTQVGVYSLYPSPDLLMWQKSVMAKHIPNTCGEARDVLRVSPNNNISVTRFFFFKL